MRIKNSKACFTTPCYSDEMILATCIMSKERKIYVQIIYMSTGGVYNNSKAPTVFLLQYLSLSKSLPPYFLTLHLYAL